MPVGRALIVGLTGGIGSGKSTVAAEFARLGAHVVDADAIAASLLSPGGAGVAAVIEAFGPQVSAEDGGINRQALGSLVFSAPDQLAVLEEILHPLIAKASRAELMSLPEGTVGVYDVPLLTEKQLQDQFDVVVVVEAPFETRIARLADREMDRAESERRMAAQATDAERREIAHVIVDNRGDLNQLRTAVAELWENLHNH